MERLRVRRKVAEEAEAFDDEKESEDVVEVLGNLKIEAAGMEEEVEEQLKAALEMEVEEEEEGEG